MKISAGILFLILILLNIYDAYSTTILIKNGGTEYNLLLAFLMERVGVVTTLVVTKCVAIIFIIVVYIRMLKAQNIPMYRKIIAVLMILACNLYYIYFMLNYNYKYMQML